jgi:serine/threonine protein kinase
MELLPGESLRSCLAREKVLAIPVALPIARQVSLALTALHRAGFVHGDVKPDNIHLLGDGAVKLIDLGLAHRPGENAAFHDEGYLLGTADYLAPELCTCGDEEDPRSDVFSLGVTIFEMLAGELPYAPGTARQTLRRHCREAPADLWRSVPDASEPLVALVNRLMARQPTDRPRASAIAPQLIGLEIALLRRSA